MTVAHGRGRENEIPLSERILIDERTAAALCSVSLPTFRSWVRSGLIPMVDLPGGLRRNLYRRLDVEHFAAGRGGRI